MTQHPRIAVIILNFNSAEHTLRCIDSILRQTTGLSEFSLIVVDNNSALLDRQKLAALPANKVKLMYSSRNLGFSGGMMLGAQSLVAEYYFFLNNDCELQNDALSVLAAFMDTNQNAALCSGSMFDAAGKPRSSFNYFPSLSLTLLGSGLLRLFHPHRYPNRRKSYVEPIQVDVVTGAAMFVRGTVLHALDGLDTGYFLYCEEEDFALRVKKACWKTYFVPQARIMHVGGASSSDITLRPALQREFYISFFRYLRLHHGLVYALVFRILIVLRLLRRAFAGKAPYSLAGFVARGAPEKVSLRYKPTA